MHEHDSKQQPQAGMLLVSSKVCNYYEVCIDTLANDNSIISSPPPPVSHIFHQIGNTLPSKITLGKVASQNEIGSKKVHVPDDAETHQKKKDAQNPFFWKIRKNLPMVVGILL